MIYHVSLLFTPLARDVLLQECSNILSLGWGGVGGPRATTVIEGLFLGRTSRNQQKWVYVIFYNIYKSTGCQSPHLVEENYKIPKEQTYMGFGEVIC